MEELFEKLKDENLSTEDRIITFSEIVQNFISEGDYDNALKYASMATICTLSPSSFACCLIGDVYLLLNNYLCAEFWYKFALNTDCTMVVSGDSGYSSWKPLVKLSNVSAIQGDAKKAKDLANAAITINPLLATDNE